MDTTKSPLDRVLEISEIIERVSAHLNHSTITSAARVSKSWHRAYLPILWHTIDNGKHWNDPRFLESVALHGDLIRVLICNRYDEIDLLIPRPKIGAASEQSVSLCRYLTRVVMPKTTARNQKQQVQLILQNPGLRDLSLTFQDELSSTFPELVEAIAGLQHLRRLAFDKNRSLEVSTLEKILQGCSRISPDGENGSLQELSLSGTAYLRHPFGRGEDFASGLLATTGEGADWTDTQDSRDITIPAKVPFAITTLHMDRVGCVQDLLLNLCSRFPSLSKLTLIEANELYYSDGFPKRLSLRCPNIKWLDVSQTEDMDDETMAELISSFPGLQTFIAEETRFGTESLNALVEHCRDLAVLDISSAYEMDSSAMQRLLNTSWSLRSLNAWGVAYDVVEMMQEAHREQKRQGGGSILSDGQPWVCTGIEKLILNVIYTPPDDPLVRSVYPPSRARRFLYDQLGRLTKLRYLALETSWEDDGDIGDRDDGNDYNYGERKTDKHPEEVLREKMEQMRLAGASRERAMEDEEADSNEIWVDYSFKSGLRRLEALKELRQLSLHGVSHNINLAEVRWMAESWPHLRKIEYLTGTMSDQDAQTILEYAAEHCPWIQFAEDD
ncbi:hypothetical protein BGZ82_011303 [Podila clonocystis]|nr:hypothetical protein BGZ82_011303 [Podila clonocystis]